jgi:hypothetical protein
MNQTKENTESNKGKQNEYQLNRKLTINKTDTESLSVNKRLNNELPMLARLNIFVIEELTIETLLA